MGVGARFEANYRHSTGGVCARHIVGEEVKKLCGQRAAVRGYFCGGGAGRQNLEWPCPVERQFRFEDLGDRARFGPLPDGSGSVVDPHPATIGVGGELL